MGSTASTKMETESLRKPYNNNCVRTKYFYEIKYYVDPEFKYEVTITKDMLKGKAPCQFKVSELYKKGRIVCVAYNYNKDTKTMTYGASVYRHDNVHECEDKKKEFNAKSLSYSKKSHRKTALARHGTEPVVVSNFEFYDDFDKFHDLLRRCVMKHGVKSKSKKV